MEDPVFLPDDPPKKSIPDRQTYNMVTDTVTGPNIRLKDNLIQGLAILACLILGAVSGAIVVADHVPGALVGGFIGLLVGLFGSGIFLMIYRAIRHARGKHD